MLTSVILIYIIDTLILLLVVSGWHFHMKCIAVSKAAQQFSTNTFSPNKFRPNDTSLITLKLVV